MGEVGGEAKVPLLSRPDTFRKWVALGGALITAWGAYVTIQTTRNANNLRGAGARPQDRPFRFSGLRFRQGGNVRGAV